MLLGKYPTVKRSETIPEDPYQWLEDLNSDETKQFIEQQNEFTMKYLQKCTCIEKIQYQLKTMMNYEKYNVPWKVNRNYYYYKNSGLQNQSILYVLKETLLSNAEVFFDPNIQFNDDTTTLGNVAFTESGQLFAYAVSENGSDWQKIYVMNAQTKEILPDCIKWVKFAEITWTKDEKGFYYERYPAHVDNVAHYTNHSIYYHLIGTEQFEDKLIYCDSADPYAYLGLQISDDNAYTFIYVYNGCNEEHKLYYFVNQLINQNITEKEQPSYTKLIDKNIGKFVLVANVGSICYFNTNYNAPNGKVISIDLEQPDSKNWKDIIPETDELLSYVGCTDNDKLLCRYLHNVSDTVKIYKLSGEFIRNLPIPEYGNVEFSVDNKLSEVFYKFTSFLDAGTIYHYDFKTDKTSVFKRINSTIDTNKFCVKQIFYDSKDGAKIPMFIIERKDLIESTNLIRPFYLYGYGGFNITIKPAYDTFKLLLLNNLNISFGIANIRGGNEYGKKWNDQGKLFNKQNCFDDFQCGAEYLIKHSYTSADKLIINGGSNGGLLVGACLTQRPDLFGCCIADIGVFDMLRFHLFTCGKAWMSDYGNPDIQLDRNYNLTYSPLHNVKPNIRYPATLITTGDNDDRVVPSHSYKFISTLQYESSCSTSNQVLNPLLLLVDVNSGHIAKTTNKYIIQKTNVIAFIIVSLGLTWREEN